MAQIAECLTSLVFSDNAFSIFLLIKLLIQAKDTHIV